MENDSKPNTKVDALFHARLKGELAIYREALERLAIYIASATNQNHVQMAHKAMQQHVEEALTWRMFSLLRIIIHVRTSYHLEPNVVLASGDTILHSLQCPLDAAVMIINANPESVKAQNKEGKTPLHAQVTRRDQTAEAIIGLLLQHGAPLHAGDNQGFTALHYAMRYHPATSSVVRMLLKHGAQNTLTILSKKKAKTEPKLKSLMQKLVAWWRQLSLNAATQ